MIFLFSLFETIIKQLNINYIYKDDCVQIAYLAWLDAIKTYNNKSPFQYWVYRIVKQHILKFIIRENKYRQCSIPEKYYYDEIYLGDISYNVARNGINNTAKNKNCSHSTIYKKLKKELNG